MIRLFCKKYIWLGWKLWLRYWSHFGGSLWTFKTKLFSSIIPWFKHWFCANVLALCLNFNCLGLSMVSSYMSHLMFAQRSNLYAFSVSLWSFWVLVYSFWEREKMKKKNTNVNLFVDLLLPFTIIFLFVCIYEGYCIVLVEIWAWY